MIGTNHTQKKARRTGFCCTGLVIASALAVDLNTLIDPDSGWRLYEANGIGDTGWVIGTGWFDPDGPGGQREYRRMFLVQIPEPTSAIVLLGASGLALLRRRGTSGGARSRSNMRAPHR